MEAADEGFTMGLRYMVLARLLEAGGEGCVERETRELTIKNYREKAFSLMQVGVEQPAP